MGDVFLELRKKQSHVQEVIRSEELAFSKTLDDGCEIFESVIAEFGSLRKFLHSVPLELDKNSGTAYKPFDIRKSEKSRAGHFVWV